MIAFPNAKINLGLHIYGKRPDGFHTIESVFYPLPFSDILEVVESHSAYNNGNFRLNVSGLYIPGGEADNIIGKAYNLLGERFSLPPVLCHLHKIIPTGAGLGGGSADAAFMLNLLNDKFGLGLSINERKDLAARLGSDCAFFIDNKPAYLLGRGPELEPFALSLKGWYLVLLHPGIHSSTAEAYAGATKREQEENRLKAILQSPVTEWKQQLVNDFETPLFAKHPLLASLKNQLYETGAVYASLSGSGSALFGLFEHKPDHDLPYRKFVCYEGLMNL